LVVGVSTTSGGGARQMLSAQRGEVGLLRDPSSINTLLDRK